MRKKFSLFYFFSILLILLTILKFNVKAQTPTLSGEGLTSDLKPDVKLECVTFLGDNRQSRGAMNKGLIGKEHGTVKGNCSSSKGCTLFMCAANNVCTTFKAEDDMKYFIQDNTDKTNPAISGYPNGINSINKKTKYPDKYLPILELDSGTNTFAPGPIEEGATLITTKEQIEHYYLLYAASEPELLGTGVDVSNASQQQGEADFVTEESKEVCAAIFWDPYGRLFDAVSLEPLNENQATVTLLDENGNKSLNTLSNDVPIDKIGKYNISINQDGKYKLNVTPLIEHLFTATEPDGRYKDLYDFIYKAGDPAFEEKAADPKRVDIPLQPKGEPYTRNPDYVGVEYKDIWFNGETYTKVDLRTVHPRTIIKVIIDGVQQKEDGAGNLLPETSDKQGYWLALIKKKVLSQEGFSIELIKNPQYYPFANSTKVIKFDPILDYIEGFLYDDNGKIISKAKVNVKLKMNDKTYYSTITDDSGFLTIYPKNLPPYEIYLEYIDPLTSKIFTKTTTQFVEDNNAYIKSEKLNLIQGTKQDQKIIDPNTGKLNNIVKNDNPLQQNGQTPTSTKTAFNPAILIIILIISLLVIVTLGLVLYIKKSKSF